MYRTKSGIDCERGNGFREWEGGLEEGRRMGREVGVSWVMSMAEVIRR